MNGDCFTVKLSWSSTKNTSLFVSIESYALNYSYMLTNKSWKTRTIVLPSNSTSYLLPSSLLLPDTNYTFSVSAIAQVTEGGSSYEVTGEASVVTVFTPSCPGEVNIFTPVAYQGCVSGKRHSSVVYLANWLAWHGKQLALFA